ncbi:MAG: STAS domain-containing protein [Spirochaetales bacterium]|nr:STAS domain-containing protein [Spirochaetales bacterium]
MNVLLSKNADDGYRTVLLDGDCDLYSAPSMRDAILALIARGTRRLRLDFGKVGYLDSTGVGSIIRILHAMKAIGGTVVFRGLAGSPRKVLEYCNVISVMRLEEGDAA